jgi:hypothetical protein
MWAGAKADLKSISISAPKAVGVAEPVKTKQPGRCQGADDG